MIIAILPPDSFIFSIISSINFFISLIGSLSLSFIFFKSTKSSIFSKSLFNLVEGGFFYHVYIFKILILTVNKKYSKKKNNYLKSQKDILKRVRLEQSTVAQTHLLQDKHFVQAGIHLNQDKILII